MCSGIRDLLLYCCISTYTHIRSINSPREDTAGSVQAMKTLLPSLLQWTFVFAAATAIRRNKGLAHGLQQSPLASPSQRSIRPQSCSCLHKYISPLFCRNTLEWPPSSILFFLLVGREKGKHNKMAKITLDTWRRRKGSITQHPKHNGARGWRAVTATTCLTKRPYCRKKK